MPVRGGPYCVRSDRLTLPSAPEAAEYFCPKRFGASKAAVDDDRYFQCRSNTLPPLLATGRGTARSVSNRFASYCPRYNIENHSLCPLLGGQKSYFLVDKNGLPVTPRIFETSPILNRFSSCFFMISHQSPNCSLFAFQGKKCAFHVATVAWFPICGIIKKILGVYTPKSLTRPSGYDL